MGRTEMTVFVVCKWIARLYNASGMLAGLGVLALMCANSCQSFVDGRLGNGVYEMAMDACFIHALFCAILNIGMVLATRNAWGTESWPELNVMFSMMVPIALFANISFVRDMAKETQQPSISRPAEAPE